MTMQTARVIVKGIAPLLTNNPQTVDRFNDFARKMKSINGKVTNRIARQRKAVQSNADCPLRGHSESFWLKGIARQCKSSRRIARQRSAVQCNSKQRGLSVTRAFRVVLAQRNAVHCRAPHRCAKHSIARQCDALKSNAVSSSSELIRSL